MSVTGRAQVVGKLYADGKAGNQFYLYLGKVRGICDRYDRTVKEGYCYLYLGRVWEFLPTDHSIPVSERDKQWKTYLTREQVIFRAQEALCFRLGQCFSIVKQRKPMAYEYYPGITLSYAEICSLCSFGHLLRLE